MIVTREDSFRSARIRSLAWILFDTPCWHAPEIEAALDIDLGQLGAGWLAGVDFTLVDGDDAFELYESLGKMTPAERPLPAVVLFPTGLTLACMDRAGGDELRRLLLSVAADDVREKLGHARLERELEFLFRDEEMQDRARKAVGLHRAVEAARRSGHLVHDDAGYAQCMASIAEIATGLRFPTRLEMDEGSAGEVRREPCVKADSPEI